MRKKIGEIVNVVGIKGELKIYPLVNYDEDYAKGNLLYINNEKFIVEKSRKQKTVWVMKLEGLDDRNIAERKKGQFIEIDVIEEESLPEDTFYVSTLIGMEVKTEEGEYIGKVTNVIQNSAQDVYEITTDEGKQVLIPAVKAFIANIDSEEKVITVSVIEGLLEL